MANITPMLSDEQHRGICPEDVTSNCTTIAVSGKENDCIDYKALGDFQCFVCDIKIQGRYYSLATCRTQMSRTRVIEKLGELVGERYMVVISEDDVICRSCANTINTLDRLEIEMSNMRDNVLRFLEQKYSLEEGELLSNTEKQKRSQPPQITKCNSQTLTTFQSKKADIVMSSNSGERSKCKRNNVWLQCDKCQYTTMHNSFMLHHSKDHRYKPQIICDKCGIQFYEHQQKSHNCSMKDNINDQNSMQNKHGESTLKSIDDGILDIPILEKDMQENLPIMTVETYSESHIPNCNETVPIIRLSNSENLSLQNILNTDNTSVPDQPIYVRVLQPVENNETSGHLAMMESNADADIAIKLKDSAEKQILTLAEDGQFEMSEITCWNDIQSSQSQSSIIFQ